AVFETEDNSLVDSGITSNLLSDECSPTQGGINGEYSAFRCVSTVFGLHTYLVMIQGDQYGYREVPNLNSNMYADGIGGVYYTVGNNEALYYSTLSEPAPLLNSFDDEVFPWNKVSK